MSDPTQTAVWLLELILDHEPGHIEGVYTTKALAKAGAPSVREWKPDGDAGVEVEVTRRFDSMWCVTPFPLDPDPAVASPRDDDGRWDDDGGRHTGKAQT